MSNIDGSPAVKVTSFEDMSVVSKYLNESDDDGEILLSLADNNRLLLFEIPSKESNASELAVLYSIGVGEDT